MPHYVLSVCYPAGMPAPSPRELEAIMRDVSAVNAEIKAAGAWVFAGAVAPPEASTMVRLNGGETLVTDGPFVETKEQIGGFNVIHVADLDAALKWAARLTRACRVPIEVRPIQSHG
jgi:hypothetical protein